MERSSRSDVPNILRRGDAPQLSEILQRSNLHIGNAIKQLIAAKETGGSVRILNIALEGRKKKFTTLPRRGNGEIRNIDEFSDEYDRGEPRPTVCILQTSVGIHAYMDEQIQCLWS